MAMTVIDSEGIADEMLPLAQLAAQMRLADGFETVPGQADRLRLRLRAAIAAVEQRLGKILIEREVIVTGAAPGGRRVGLPVAPVVEVVGVAVTGASRAPTAEIEPDPHRPVVVLADTVGAGKRLTITLRAGFGAWDAVPDPLRQAVLLMAEALDAGEGATLLPAAAALIAPFRDVRVGGAR